MRTEILKTQQAILGLYQVQRQALAGKSESELRDLQHECGELMHHQQFSTRTAAEINFAASEMVLLDRAEASKTK